MNRPSFILAILFIGKLFFLQANTDDFDRKLKGLSGPTKLEALIKVTKEVAKSNPEESVIYANEALKLAIELKQKEKIPECYLLLSEAYLHSKSPDSAMFFAQNAMEGFKKTRQPDGIIKACNQTGLAYLRNGNVDQAAKTFNDAIGLCNQYLLKDSDNKTLSELAAEIFNNLMLTYIKQGNYQKAKTRLLEYNKKSDMGKTYIGMLVQSNLSVVYNLMGQYDSALIRANSALQIAASLDEPLNEVKIVIDVADIYNMMGKYSESLEHYRKAMKMLLPLGDKQKLATLYNNMASLYKKISQYEKATSYFLEAAKIKEELNDSAGMAVTYNNLALVYKNWAQYDKARQYLMKAVATNTRKNIRKNLAVNFTGLGDLYLNLGQADSAIYYFKKSYDIKTEIGHKQGIVYALHGLGNVYAQLLSDENTAMDYYQEALTLAKEIGSEQEISDLNISIGEIMFQQNKLALAAEYFGAGLEYAKKENTPEQIQKCSEFLMKINILTGDKKTAFEYFTQYKQAGDSIFNERVTKSVTEMQIKYETEKKEQENQILMLDAAAKRKQIHYLIWISAIITALSTIIIFLYRQKVIALNQIVLRNLEIVKSEKLIEFDRQSVIKASAENSHPEVPETEDLTKNLLVRLEKYIMEEKPYLIPGLSLEDVCRKLNTNRSYLSQIINDHYKQNFNSYINDQRIKEARRLFSSDNFDHISVEGVGSMVGFSNKVTFHTNFKNFTGVTPAFFRTAAKKYV